MTSSLPSRSEDLVPQLLGIRRAVAAIEDHRRLAAPGPACHPDLAAIYYRSDLAVLPCRPVRHRRLLGGRGYHAGQRGRTAGVQECQPADGRAPAGRTRPTKSSGMKAGITPATIGPATKSGPVNRTPPEAIRGPCGCRGRGIRPPRRPSAAPAGVYPAVGGCDDGVSWPSPICCSDSLSSSSPAGGRR